MYQESKGEVSEDVPVKQILKNYQKLYITFWSKVSGEYRKYTRKIPDKYQKTTIKFQRGAGKVTEKYHELTEKTIARKNYKSAKNGQQVECLWIIFTSNLTVLRKYREKNQNLLGKVL